VPVLAAQKEIGMKAPAQATLLRTISDRVEGVLKNVEILEMARAKAEALEDVEKRAFAFCGEVKPLFEKIRADVDALELMLPSDLWPVPKYREMLFLM
jgi:glutamine synthetase